MKKIFGLLLLIIAVIGVSISIAQTPVEVKDSQTVFSAQTVLFRHDSADSTVFRLDGATDTEESGIYWAWKTMGVSFTASGDSVNFTVLFHSGHGEYMTGSSTLADTTTTKFGAAFDSLAVTSAGDYVYQFSNNMPIDTQTYMEFRANTGNGDGTTISDGVVTKDRY